MSEGAHRAMRSVAGGTGEWVAREPWPAAVFARGGYGCGAGKAGERAAPNPGQDPQRVAGDGSA